MPDYTFIVRVSTDPKHIDAPSMEDIAEEIGSNLAYDAHSIGITHIEVDHVPRDYRTMVITGGMN